MPENSLELYQLKEIQIFLHLLLEQKYWNKNAKKNFFLMKDTQRCCYLSIRDAPDIRNLYSFFTSQQDLCILNL